MTRRVRVPPRLLLLPFLCALPLAACTAPQPETAATPSLPPRPLRVAPYVSTETTTQAQTCTASELAAALDTGNSSEPTDTFSLRVQNRSTSPCQLPAAVGLKVSAADDIVLTPMN